MRVDRAGPAFKLHRGVKQGDPLSLNLLQRFWNTCFKIDGRCLSHFRSADDIVLISLAGLVEESGKAGFKVTVAKTKVIINTFGVHIWVEGVELEIVEEYAYLG